MSIELRVFECTFIMAILTALSTVICLTVAGSIGALTVKPVETVPMHQTLNESVSDCRLLVLSGGGSHGAYEAGVLAALVEHEHYKDFTHFAGVSVGAINAAYVAQFDSDQKAVGFLHHLWSVLSRNDVYRSWPLGWLQALLNKTGLYDTTPLWELIRHDFNPRALQRNLWVGATRVDTGDLTVFTNSNVSRKAVLASASIPTVFPAVTINDVQYVDGGLRDNIPYDQARKLCPAPNLAVVVTAEPLHVEGKSGPAKSLLDMLLRTLELASDTVSERGIGNVDRFTLVIRPEKPLPFSSLDFEHGEELWELGYQDGKKVL